MFIVSQGLGRNTLKHLPVKNAFTFFFFHEQEDSVHVVLCANVIIPCNRILHLPLHIFFSRLDIIAAMEFVNTVEPRYNEALGTMEFTLLYQVSHYIRVKKLRNIKCWNLQTYLVIAGFCCIRPLYNEVSL